MVSLEEARIRVARGAAHLDQVRPNWFNEIDTGTLDLQSGCFCVLGQLTNGAFDEVAIGFRSKYSITAEESATYELVTHGFSLNLHAGEVPDWINEPERRIHYRTLQDAWIEAIAARRHPMVEPAETREAVTA